MKGLAHAFPEFKEEKSAKGTNHELSEFKLLSDLFPYEERKILPEVEAELGRKIQEAEKQGYLKGLREGEQRGIEQGRKDVEPIITNLSQALEELEKVKVEIYSYAEKAAVRLAIALAEKIIQQEIRSDPSIVIRMAESVLRGIKDRQSITLRLNPHDAQSLRSLGYDLEGIFNGGRKFSLLEDPSVERGGFVVQTESGELDARITQQLETAKELLLGESSQTV